MNANDITNSENRMVLLRCKMDYQFLPEFAGKWVDVFCHIDNDEVFYITEKGVSSEPVDAFVRNCLSLKRKGR
jgi:hypothetical protein